MKNFSKRQSNIMNTKKRYPINEEYCDYIRKYHKEKKLSICINCRKEFEYPIKNILTGIPMYDFALRMVCLPCSGIKDTDEYKNKWPYTNQNSPGWFEGESDVAI